MSIPIRRLIPPEAKVLTRWIEYAADYMSADSYWVFSLLTAVSAAINGRVVINPGSEPSAPTNLFTVLVGPSGAHKGVPPRHALDLLRSAVPETPVLPEDFTSESILGYLAEESTRLGSAKGLIVNEELVTLIGGKEYRAENARFLLKLWDSRAYYSRYTRMHDLEEIRNPYITLLSAIQPSTAEELDPKILSQGFLSRVLIVCESGPKHEYSQPKQDVQLLMALAAVMRLRVGEEAFGACSMILPAESQAMNRRWCEEHVVPLRSGLNEREDHFASRMELHALKLAACVALLEGWAVPRSDGKGFHLMPDALRLGQQLVEVITPSMFDFYSSLASTPLAKLRAAIIRTVEKAGGKIAYTKLIRQVSMSAGASGGQIKEAVDNALANKQLTTKGGDVCALHSEGVAEGTGHGGERSGGATAS
jgi:hypothetical protein